MAKLHFISGLPRSGSTLLSSLLRQNPRFHAGMTSPVGAMFSPVLSQFGAGSEFGPTITKEQRQRLLRGLFSSYYADQKGKGVIFDTNRMWCSKLPALRELYPSSKVIACVRNVAWVMDSLEKLYRANPFETTKLYASDAERSTVYSRVGALANRDRLVGFAWEAVKEAFYSPHADALLLVEYEALAESPERVLRHVYDFIGEEWYPHDFNNAQFDAPQFDQALGLDGLHRVRPTVSLQPRATLLPPDLFSTYTSLSFWEKPGADVKARVIRRAAEIQG